MTTAQLLQQLAASLANNFYGTISEHCSTETALRSKPIARAIESRLDRKPTASELSTLARLVNDEIEAMEEAQEND